MRPVSETRVLVYPPKYMPSFHMFISSQGCLSYPSTIYSLEIKPCPITEAHVCGKPGTPVTMGIASWEERTGRAIEACRPGSPASMATVQANERHCFKQKVEILVHQDLRWPSALHTLHFAHVHPHEHLHTHNANICMYTHILKLIAIR